MTDVTQLLLAAEQGDPKAVDELFPLVYSELRKLAAAKLARETPGQTLQATALVHEVYLRLVGNESRTALEQSPARHWNSRGHFFGAAAEAMRRILVEGARRRSRLKRGGDRERIELELDELIEGDSDEELLAVDQALTRFSLEEPRKASLVKLRYFGGLTMNEAALALGISLATAERHWRYARAKLARYVRDGQ
jgi:RNA polymerase sigma factor (TIGR02999 family)